MARGSVRPVQRKGLDGRPYTVYRARVPAGATPDGKRRQVTKYHKTRREADKWVAEQLARPVVGAARVDRAITLGALLDRWLELHAESVGSGSVYSYGWASRRITRDLGDLVVSSLEVLHLQAYYDRIKTELKPASVDQIHKVLVMALDLAVDWEIISRNPVKGTRRPSIGKTEIVCWQPHEVQAFLNATRDDFDGPLWALILHTALRIGEAIALDWSDVDIESGRVSVRRTMTRNANGRTIVGTKTKSSSSARTIVIPLPAQMALRRQLAAQEDRRRQLGDAWIETGAVFDRGDGVRRNLSAVRRRFGTLVRTLDLPALTPHGLRHTVATLLFRRGVSPKRVQALLGHAKIQITLDLYTHIDEADMDGVADVLGTITDPPVREVPQSTPPTPLRAPSVHRRAVVTRKSPQRRGKP